MVFREAVLTGPPAHAHLPTPTVWDGKEPLSNLRRPAGLSQSHTAKPPSA